MKKVLTKKQRRDLLQGIVSSLELERARLHRVILDNKVKMRSLVGDQKYLKPKLAECHRLIQQLKGEIDESAK